MLEPAAEPAHALPGPPRRALVPPRPRPRLHAQRPGPGAGARPPPPTVAPLRAPGQATPAVALVEGGPRQLGCQAARPVTRGPGVHPGHPAALAPRDRQAQVD